MPRKFNQATINCAEVRADAGAKTYFDLKDVNDAGGVTYIGFGIEMSDGRRFNSFSGKVVTRAYPSDEFEPRITCKESDVASGDVVHVLRLLGDGFMRDQEHYNIDKAKVNPPYQTKYGKKSKAVDENKRSLANQPLPEPVYGMKLGFDTDKTLANRAKRSDNKIQGFDGRPQFSVKDWNNKHSNPVSKRIEFNSIDGITRANYYDNIPTGSELIVSWESTVNNSPFGCSLTNRVATIWLVEKAVPSDARNDDDIANQFMSAAELAKLKADIAGPATATATTPATTATTPVTPQAVRTPIVATPVVIDVNDMQFDEAALVRQLEAQSVKQG